MTTKARVISAVEKAQFKLNSLKMETEAALTEYTSSRKESRSLLIQRDNLYNALEDAKDAYSLIKMQAETAFKRAARTREHFEKMQKQVELSELEIEIIMINKKQKEEKKERTKILKQLEKKGVQDTLLKSICRLPEDMVKIIESFIPEDEIYSLKVRSLESQVNTNVLIKCCDVNLQKLFLKHISFTREFLGILPTEEERIKEIYRLENGQSNREYNPYSSVYYTKEASYKILHVIEMAKIGNPKFAYNILKKIHILFDPSKKYKKNYAYGKKELVWRDLTMNDLYSLDADTNADTNTGTNTNTNTI